MTRPTLGARVTRTFVQRIDATPEEVFPLLCPEMEKAWLPGWDYRMIHSRSGVAERGAVFETRHELGRTVWIVAEHDPPRRVAFARWQPDGVLVHIEISLGRHVEGDSAVCIAYTHTATDEPSSAAVGRLEESDWLDTMSFWQGSMNAWLEKRRPRGAPGR